MESLQNHFLIAMPSLDDTFFERTVIYLCEHDEKGAMGLVINKPLGIEVNSLLEQMDLPTEQVSADFAMGARRNGGDYFHRLVLHVAADLCETPGLAALERAG